VNSSGGMKNTILGIRKKERFLAALFCWILIEKQLT